MTATILTVRNANDGLYAGLKLLATHGTREAVRGGVCLVAPGPVLTQYERPRERVLFSQLRDANPFFHLYEAVWMMAGRDDAASVGRYAKTMETFADPDGKLNGAYGKRWREHFGYDQLVMIAEELGRNRGSRRCVLTMWDARLDPESARQGSPDVPCNTQVYFEVRFGELRMTVCNRSNDIVWGCYGANFVHMGFLQEVLAAALGVKVGTYTQMSNNFHLYLGRPDVDRLITGDPFQVKYTPDDRYMNGVPYVPLAWNGTKMQLNGFLAACQRAAESPTAVLPSDGVFLYKVFLPLMKAHSLYKQGDFQGAQYELSLCAAEDWRIAAREWLYRREAARVPA